MRSETPDPRRQSAGPLEGGSAEGFRPIAEPVDRLLAALLRDRELLRLLDEAMEREG